MKNINTHGRNIVLDDLIQASKDTTDLAPLSGYYGLFYDRSTGEVWAKYHSSSPEESWTVYHDDDIISLGAITRHVSVQHLADMIDRAIEHDDFIRAEYEKDEKERKEWEAWIEENYKG